MTELASAAIGLNGQLHSRIKWVRLPVTDISNGSESTSSSWWPGFFYENYSDFIKDVNPQNMDLKAQAAQCYWSFKTRNQGASPSLALVFQGSTFLLRTMPSQNLTEDTSTVLDFYMHMQEFDQNQDDNFQESIQKAMDWMRLSLSSDNTKSNEINENLATNIDSDASDNDASSLVRGRNEVSPEERNKQKKLKQKELRTNTVTKYMSRDSNKTVHPTKPRRVSDQHEIRMDSGAASTNSQCKDGQNLETKDRVASVQNTDDDVQDNFDINPYDSWSTVYKKMKRGGWTHRNGDLFHSYFYVKPGCTVKNGTMNVDYFTSEEQLQDYARKHYGWQDSVVENDRLLSQYQKKNEQDDDEGEDDVFGSQPNDEDEDLVDDSLDEPEEGYQSKNKQNVVSNVFEYEDEPSNTTATIVVTNKRSRRDSTSSSTRERKVQRMMNHNVSTKSKNYKVSNPKKKTVPSKTKSSGPPTPSFKEIWPQLSSMGWKCVFAKMGGEDFYRPGYGPKDPDLVQGEHYFHERDELLQYVKNNDVGLEHLNDESISDNDSEEHSDGVTTKVSVVSNGPKKMKTSKISKKKTVPSKSKSSGPPTPSFKEIWPQLSSMGWKCVFAKMGGEDFYRPGYGPKDPDLVQGEHYFHERDELLQYVKNNDVGLEYLNDESVSDNDSEAHSGKYDVDGSVTSPALSESSTESSYQEPFVIEGCDNCWWNSESIPKFMVLWNIIREKLGVSYVGGNYKTTDGATFTNPDEMLQHLNRYGVSTKHMNSLTDEERTCVTRLISMSNLPKKIGPYSLNPNTSQALLSNLLEGGSFGDDRAWAVLVRYFGGQNPDGEYSLGLEYESFPHCVNLSEVREAIRKGYLNHKGGKDNDMDEAYAALILWASSLPIPLIPDDDENQEREDIDNEKISITEGNDGSNEKYDNEDMNPLTQAEACSDDHDMLNQEVDEDVTMASSPLQLKAPPSAQLIRNERMNEAVLSTPIDVERRGNECSESPSALSNDESEIFFNIMTYEEISRVLNPPHEEVSCRSKALFKSTSSDVKEDYGTPENK